MKYFYTLVVLLGYIQGRKWAWSKLSLAANICIYGISRKNLFFLHLRIKGILENPYYLLQFQKFKSHILFTYSKSFIFIRFCGQNHSLTPFVVFCLDRLDFIFMTLKYDDCFELNFKSQKYN